MMMSNAKPYDAEVAWLYSDGSAYIDTGIEATGDLSVECSAKSTSQRNAAICGAIYDRGSGQYYRTHLSIQYFYGGSSVGSSLQSYDVFQYVHLNVEEGKILMRETVHTFTPATFSCNCNYGIFARLSSNMEIQSKPSAFEWFKLRRGGVLLRDYIPVRVGTTGYLYDKVSGQLFGNVGTGSFVLGNDIY